MGQREILEVLQDRARITDPERWWLTANEVRAELIKRRTTAGIGRSSLVRSLKKLRETLPRMVEHREMIVRTLAGGKVTMEHRLRPGRKKT